jgi:hypothetical protein
MTIELNETYRPGYVRDGSTVLNLSADEWLQIRSGLLSSPDVALQEQVPAGKAWAVRISVYIEERDA